MNYPAQSNIWKLDMATRPREYGRAIVGKGESRVLATVKQFVPLTLFPDTLIVEELRIIWDRKLGFWMRDVISIMATDIASVECSTGLIFGHIHIKSLTGGPEIVVNNLKVREVVKIRSLVEGIALTAREGLRVSGDSLEAERQSLMRAGAIN